MVIGAGMGLRVHYGPNSFKFGPGLLLNAAYFITPRISLSAGIFAGAFMGNSIMVSLSGSYSFLEGVYRPEVGVSMGLDFGSVVFHTDSGFSYVYPSNPEWCISLVIRPLLFTINRVRISFLDLSAGTDVLLAGRILLLNVELLTLGYRW